MQITVQNLGKDGIYTTPSKYLSKNNEGQKSSITGRYKRKLKSKKN
jgi:hypothetical protein